MQHHHHLSRRDLLKAGGAATALAVTGVAGLADAAGADDADSAESVVHAAAHYDDTLDTQQALNGTWSSGHSCSLRG